MVYDKEFLRELDKHRNKIIYGRITTLQLNETPIMAIEGRITGGSINIDGASAVRRTCSLTMVAESVDVSDYQWGLNTKFKLEIGLKNTINKNYPEIIWFPQGIFLITSFSSSLSTNNYTINLSGKDKMCLLNGEVGGSLTASTQFDSWEREMPDGSWKIEKYPLKLIIMNAVHQFAGEPFSNIIINDLDEMGLELLEYRYNTPLYLIRKQDDVEYSMGTLNGDMQFNATTLGAKDEDGNYIHTYDPLVDALMTTNNSTVFTRTVNGELKKYCAAKIEYGDTAGYRYKELVYPDELVGNVGESITSILDKIKNIFGQFEYFYDVNGHFIFQKKQDYVNTLWSPIKQNEDDTSYVEGIEYSTSATYSFIGNDLITAFNNSPNLNNLRNDYSVWGTRSGANNKGVMVHMRYAIDEKPIYYRSFGTKNEKGEIIQGPAFCTQKHVDAKVVDWREIIFQMQKDYRKHNHEDDFEVQLIKNNPPIPELEFQGYPTGQTGYEQYYIDLEGFWRQLYYPEYAKTEEEDKWDKKIRMKEEEVAAAQKGSDTTLYENLQKELTALEIAKQDFIDEYLNTYYHEDHDGSKLYWNKNVFEAPELLNYWIDFLDADGELSQFSCKAVGCRPKAVNDTNVKSIYFRETPAIIFATKQEMDLNPQNSAYRHFQVANFENMFLKSAQGKSAKDVIDELIYQHAYCVESANITAIPVYYLQPNTRIYIHDDNSGISGDYIVSKITLPLTYNGTMSLTTTKAAEKIL